jgi:hypothetical protein
MKRIVYYIFSDVSLKREKVSFDTSHHNRFDVCMLYCSCLHEMVREIIQFDARTLLLLLRKLQPRPPMHLLNNFLVRDTREKQPNKKNGRGIGLGV